MHLIKKAIRVGIAAALCMLAANLLNLKFPFFVLLPAVMPISTFFGETIKFGINRIIGTTIGAIIGVILVTLQSQNIFLIGIGVIIIIYTCNYLKWDSTTSIACLVFLAIMTGVKESALTYSIHRLVDTFIGIAITTLVNNYVFNPDIIKLINDQTKNIQEKLLFIAKTKDFLESKRELDKIELEISNIKEKLRIYTEEVKINPQFSSTKSKLDNIISTLSIIFEQIKIINYINSYEYKKLNYDINIDKNSFDIVNNLHKDIFFLEMKKLDNIFNDIE
ncbi:FUSC family protein [Clostridium beijerinckii]|uniref:Aromatic acid exporter family protein n=1 Tax=Clostridium beijerinckii TaxID=1520 RepID=A0A1S9N502_CLOBE|nr:aromatic acid exporter family protein [Clostridium beijerinckii]MZK51097.1 aromatic acid exporter family protein [Clostridium beijerinckii]MZK59299.1 aromatic acid exporter family protein [Clostridium beijerinckii]MZK69418.1 aromatic acid exporter family protein [Clostridium beijerinckii]MZK74791.1 aromatic acid exporter family protein [Clostridium beijerinckii]MZK84509.1 aromatic acid exporter family protein [Clostridium beijerinckii]